MNTVETVEITKRPVYPKHGGRKRTVYDADGTVDGIECWVRGAKSEREAKLLIKQQVEFVKREGSCSALGFSLAATNTECFTLRFPSGGSHLFGARTLRDALIYVAYAYDVNSDVQAFVSSVLVQGLERA